MRVALHLVVKERTGKRMRVSSELWVKALLRRAVAAGAMCVVVRHGDDTAGSIFVKVNRLDGSALLFGPAPAGLSGMEETRRLIAMLNPDGNPEVDIDAYLSKQLSFDPDLWVVEIEDRAGRAFLED